MEITCNLCGGSSISDWFQINSDKFYVSEKQTRHIYTIGRCNDCGLIFVKEMPTAEELKDIYSEGYYKGRDKIGYGNYEEKLGESSPVKKSVSQAARLS